MELRVEQLEIYAYHGVLPEETRLGQQFIFDVSLRLPDPPALETDGLDDTINYVDVIEEVTEAATEATYNLLERVAAAVADRLLARFPVSTVIVKVTKPHPPVPDRLAGVSVTVERRRP